MDYYYEENSKRIGPIKKEEVQTLLDTGVLDRETRVWCSEYTDWKLIGNTDFDLSHIAPPPLSASSINNTYFWILAFMPIISSLVEYFFAYMISDNDIAADKLIEDGDLMLISLVLNILFSWFDERQLKNAGYNTGKFRGWVWLVPVYMFVRIKHTKIHIAPFVIWIISFIISIYL